MPTTNPRIAVTLSPSTDALVGRLAARQRISKAQVLRELLEAVEPSLQKAVALMDAAEGAKGAMLGDLAATMERIQSKAEANYRTIVGASDSLTADLVAEAQAIRGRRPRGAPLAGGSLGDGPARVLRNPPASNRGVKSTKRGRTSSKAVGQK